MSKKLSPEILEQIRKEEKDHPTFIGLHGPAIRGALLEHIKALEEENKNMKITKAIVITSSYDCDHCYLFVDLPSPMPKMEEITGCKHQTTLSFDAMADHGAKYIKEHFGIEAEVVDRNRT